MRMKIEKSELSVILKEIDRLSEEPDLMLTSDEIKDYEEIRVLGEIIFEMQSPKLIFYTDT
jgi:hypothetical protein